MDMRKQVLGQSATGRVSRPVSYTHLKDEVYYCTENCSQIIEKYSIKTGEKSAIDVYKRQEQNLYCVEKRESLIMEMAR